MPYYYLDGGGGGSRTRVRNMSKVKSFTSLVGFYHPPTKIGSYKTTLTSLLR